MVFRFPQNTLKNAYVFKIFSQLGKCRSRLQRFYYDTDIGVCRTFIYSGCQGNGNNFESENECIKTCVPDHKIETALEDKTLYLGKI